MDIKIGKLRFSVNYPPNWDIPQNVKKFTIKQYKKESERFEPELLYDIKFKNEIKQDSRKIITVRQDLIIGSDGNLETRYLFVNGMDYPYAKYTEIDHKNITVEILNDFKDMFKVDTMFWSLLALEKHMIKKNALIFHCAYTSYKDKAILFSGPSGIGKSTQADLWEKNRGAEILNGDKCLISPQNISQKYEKENEWYAFGWPVCGSSEICLNQNKKLGSIVFLKQGKRNEVVKLNQVESVKKIISQSTINYWNADFVNCAFSIAEDISKIIDIYQLTCNQDIGAVDILEKNLKI